MRGKCGAQISAFPSCSWHCWSQRAFSQQSFHTSSFSHKPFCVLAEEGVVGKAARTKAGEKGSSRQPEHGFGAEVHKSPASHGAALWAAVSAWNAKGAQPGSPLEHPMPRTRGGFSLCLMARCTSVRTEEIIHIKNPPRVGNSFCFSNHTVCRKQPWN